MGRKFTLARGVANLAVFSLEILERPRVTCVTCASEKSYEVQLVTIKSFNSQL